MHPLRPSLARQILSVRPNDALVVGDIYNLPTNDLCAVRPAAHTAPFLGTYSVGIAFAAVDRMGASCCL